MGRVAEGKPFGKLVKLSGNPTDLNDGAELYILEYRLRAPAALAQWTCHPWQPLSVLHRVAGAGAQCLLDLAWIGE